MVVPASTDPLAALRSFRSLLYSCLSPRRDALFELTDALLTAGPVPGPAYLSLEAVHRRGWGSRYAALVHGAVDAEAVRALLAAHPLVDAPLIYAADVRGWPRCDAQTSPDRGS